MKNRINLFLLLLLFLLFLLSLVTGSSSYPLSAIFRTLADRSSNPALAYILFDMRIPRTLCALLTGMVLSVSGSVFQAVLRNPMAEPFILGVSSGASLSAALSLALGFSFLAPFALAGSLLVTLFILALSRRRRGRASLILSGVAVNYLCSSLLMLLLVLDHEHYQRIMFWTMGSFGSASYGQFFLLSLASLVSLLPFFFLSRELDLMMLDDSSALSIGLDTEKYRTLFLLLPTIAVATAVSFFGVIAFIGLLSPHLARKMLGPSHGKMLPSAALLGADILLLSDIACRVLLPTGEMPVGIITSLLGSPLLIMMLRRGGKYGS